MRDEDINIIKENMDKLVEDAKKKEIQLIEPTLDEFKQIRSIILDYIRREKRIIYGGYAWNSLVSKVNKKNAFYSDYDYTDVEFYSNKPIEDMKNICDLIHKKGFKFIQGKSAQHEETYTIFVNFQGYCDISYMPSNLFYNVMTETIDGLKMIHPKFIMIDILRQFNDPITSFRRLDKNIKRGESLMKCYPLEFLPIKPKSLELTIPDDFIKMLLSEICNMKTIIFINDIAYDAYIKSESNITYKNMRIHLISTNIKKDSEKLYNLIIKYCLDTKSINFQDDISVEQYFPFFQFTDKSIVYKYKDLEFLKIYGNNEKCIPYNEAKLSFDNKSLPIKIGTFNVIFMFYLINYHIAYSEKNKNKCSEYDYHMNQLLISRNNYLNKNNKTVLDNTIYEDFKINCLGEPISALRKFMLSRKDRRLMPRSAAQPYDPDETTNYKTDDYSFMNSSGNIINNPKEYILYTKKK